MSLMFSAVPALILFCVVMMLTRGMSGPRSYFNRHRLMSQIEDQHERLRNKRRDLLQHFYWAESNNERQSANQLENSIVELDREIEELTEEYNRVKSGKSVNFKGVK